MSRRTTAAARLARPIRLVVFAAAVVGGLAGLGVLLIHVAGDPLTDVHAYYEAGARLNKGVPLYIANADPNASDFYRYPPLLAIAFRPLALLPFPVAALVWEAVVLASLVATIARSGPRRSTTWLAVGLLGVPIAWSVAIGQAQAPVTYLTALGSPWSIALAAHLKLFPVLVALWWIGRREWRTFGLFCAWSAGLVLLQLVLEPKGTLEFLGALTLEQVGPVRFISPYVYSPVLWATLVVGGTLLALRLAPTRWGWAAAVTMSVLATPRLLVYILMTLLAIIRPPESTLGPAEQADASLRHRRRGTDG